MSEFRLSRGVRLAVTGAGGLNAAPVAIAPTITLSGPTSGITGTASTFTIVMTGLPPVGMVITMSDGGAGGVFVPTTRTTAGTFTYTNSSAGIKSISISNNLSLSQSGTPVSLTLTSSNTAPYWITATPSILGSFVEGAAYAPALSAYALDDEADTIFYSRSGGNAPPSVTVDVNTGVITIPANLALGTYTVEVELLETNTTPGTYTDYLKASETGNGTDGYHFNQMGNLKWENIGGDWTDANGSAQGPAAVTSKAISTSENVWDEMNVLPFMDRWLNTISDGMYLRSTNLQIASRNHTDPALWPHLIVTTDVGGPYTCPCDADMPLNGDAVHTSNGTGDVGTTLSIRLAVSGNGKGGAIARFDVTGVVGTPTAAVFRFYKTNVSGGAQTLTSFFVRAPVPFDARGLPVVLGPASLLENDDIAGVRALPGVIDAWDWPPDWRTNPAEIGHRFYGGTGSNAQQERHEGNGINGEENLREHPSIQGDDGSWWLRPAWEPNTIGNPNCNISPYPQGANSDPSSEGTVFGPTYKLPGSRVPYMPLVPMPTTPLGPESMYFRYSIRLNEDFASMTEDYWFTGGKFPGWDMRYGVPLATGHWDDRGGNGSSPGLGRAIPANTGGTYDQPQPYLIGSSARGGWMGGRMFGEQENPMNNTLRLANYMYGPDTSAGDDVYWFGGQLQIGREYDIEQYIQMNTIDLSTVDSVGNGVGREDGILRTWINGILVFEYTTWRFRHHPALALEGVWPLIKNGGTNQPCIAHSFCLGPMVISTNYIGPRKSLAGGLS